ncbi:MAG TPA: 3-methyl-2-oxobutanoate hydroxymethyltransferase [Candidatus Fimousia stercorigallinarum]|mgnify:CR=1 FL=1|nr:3-methyl-2-oxobutanoate hydroxymethyltransferase [Candidatus Fimousia stercorigallinarum]
MKTTVTTLQKMKEEGKKITMLTAYDYSTAKLEDEAGIDTILVGDSLGNVMLGYENTIPVTVDNMITYGASVVRGAKNAFVVIDMPFMSYQTSVYDAVCNAGRIMKETGCDAVKLEGGVKFAPVIEAITNASIPVIAHIGLTPQSINAFGGHKVQGKTEAAAKQIIEDAKAVEAAGASAIVIEGVPAAIGKLATEAVKIPTIGIGAGPDCDGQVLVYQDVLGMFTDFTPKFVKRYADIGSIMKEAFADYIKEVKEQSFPEEKHCYTMKEDVIEKLY